MLTFNTLLSGAGFELAGVRLLRHTPKAYRLWCTNCEAFEAYQAHQSPGQRAILGDSRSWAAFVVTPSRDVLFVGMYSAQLIGPNETDLIDEVTRQVSPGGSQDLYHVEADSRLAEYAGRVVVDWGAGALAWIQKAANQPKPIIEIRRSFEEPPFPGFREFVEPLSAIETLPVTWCTALRSVRGVYLLTCPRTKELYVGSASGEDGFYGRWMDYVQNGHGENVQLRSRDASDYQITILEVAGSAASRADIEALETRWKRKLQSREMGLNSN